jgi:CheY-like chemotaxis protein
VYPRSGSHVLVVDDEPVVASSLAAMLRMNGFSARFFTCPLEALAAARSGKAQEGFSADSAEGAAQADGLLHGIPCLAPAVTPSLVGRGGVSGLLDGRTVAGRLIEPETNCGQQCQDDDHAEQQSDDI